MAQAAQREWMSAFGGGAAMRHEHSSETHAGCGCALMAELAAVMAAGGGMPMAAP